ncbi:deoxyribodipyrimidine photo-lyase [Thalassospiraceae bacterium LMO-SO8]|nr:DNA photolyase family protein [Alphaproteobacteria bacterium LMO-S08]WND77233.1 deoxyribodipyrimidine photo-lyase [Thalassospiraceae bacterium LMO-SO8]
MSTPSPVIVWFRRDLRLADNPALARAAATGRPVVPVFILDEDTPGLRPPGGASRWWLHHSLAALTDDLAALGSRLILRRGAAGAVLDTLITETGADGVLWNRCYDKGSTARDTEIKAALRARGIGAESFNGALLAEPWEITTKAGGGYKVYTRFWQACRAAGDPPPPMAAPDSLAAPQVWPASDGLAAWGLTPRSPDWAAGFFDHWAPGAQGAEDRLGRFLNGTVAGYAAKRDFPGVAATSGLSAHLAWGDIGPRQVWAAAVKAAPLGQGRETFLKELVWREFAHHVLYHFPDLAERPMDGKFETFPWMPDDTLLAAWRRGQTGYPIVDAGMRELWATGTMHNRVRMVAASFLVKHLLQPWQAGEAWFWDTLLDADPASNPFNWQWVAGCGADAAPYFRIFNPILQGEKFDGAGDYVRRWVPEIAALPKKYIHAPWTAPMDVLADAGVALGRDYPAPVVDHKGARDRALAAFKSLKRG